jgi:hypothetical protein
LVVTIGPMLVLASTRVAEHVLQRLGADAVDEVVVHRFVHVDALDRAARLAGVEERAVDVLGDRELEIGVGPHVRRVLAAELEAERHEGARRRLLDGAAACRPSR